MYEAQSRTVVLSPSDLKNCENLVTPFSLKNAPKLLAVQGHFLFLRTLRLGIWIVDWAGRCVVGWAGRCKKIKKDKKSGGRAVGTTTQNQCSDTLSRKNSRHTAPDFEAGLLKGFAQNQNLDASL